MLDSIQKNLSDISFREDDLSRRPTQAMQSPGLVNPYYSNLEHAWTTTGVQLSFAALPGVYVSSQDLSYSLEAPENIERVIFAAIERLYLNQHNPRDRRIAERLKMLYRDALAEGEKMQAVSITQFTDFFVKHKKLGMPKITLTPDGTLRVRWIAGPGNFTAIEFVGGKLVKLVAEIPRDGETAQYFATDLFSNIVSIARGFGAQLA